MASDGRGRYTPLVVSNGKGELESVGMVLPPLNVQTVSSSKSWHRKAVISAIALAITTILLIAITFAVVSLTRNRKHKKEFSNVPPYNDLRKQMKLELNFQIDLKRFYEKTIEEQRLEDLIEDFEYYKVELSDVRNPSDLRDFLVVLGLKRAEYDLNNEDIGFAISLTEELHEWCSYLNELRKNLTQYDNQKRSGNLSVSPRVSVNGVKRKQLNALLSEWGKPVSTDVSESWTVFKNKVVLISEVLELLKTDPKLLKRDICVFATDTIYLDGDIFLPETNIALISPLWSFVRGINITMSGLDGVKHKYDTATLGEHGLPGRRGGNGGYFFGVGNMSVDELYVHTDGGNGSDGQHGSNGRNGTMTKPEGFISSEPFLCKKPVNDIRNIFGEVITYYEVFHNYGCGDNGTDGGAAGHGGEGGRVILVNLADGRVKADSGKMGASGNYGRGGAAGSGASWGCRFYAEGTEHGDLQQVTKEVCGLFMPSGVPGRDGWNEAGMENPIRSNSSFFSEAIRKFRTYARDEYMNGRKDMWQLAEKLDELDIFDFDNGTIIRDFIDEINAIEKMGKIEFYDSLNRRIEKALEGPWNKQALTYLRILSYGKALALRNGFGNYVIVDLDMFLEKVSDDMKSADRSTLTFTDRTAPIFLQLLKEKMIFLSDTLNQWIFKTSNLIAEYDLTLSRKPVNNLPKQIDGRNMAYLTSLTAQVIKSLSAAVLVYPEESKVKINTVDIVVNDLMIHNESKSSTGRFSRHQSRMLTELKSLSLPGSNWKPNLKNLKHLLDLLNSLINPQSEVSDFPVVLEYFESTAELLETVREKQKFSEYVAKVNSFGIVSDEVKVIRDYVLDIIITTQYKNALSVFRQWVFPHMYAYDCLLPKKKNLTVEDAQVGINILRKAVKEYKSTITSYDKFVREAVFSANNSVGEYYKWHNEDIRSDLVELFKGREISLTSDVENFHIFGKNAIKFRTVKLEFQLRQAESDKFFAMLTNVQVEMRHSGYSYYYYKGRSYLHTGEGLDLRYSYETSPNGLPVNFNMVYKKLMDGPPIFSPYTTWIIRLNPVPEGLINFVEDVDVALVGLGTYIEVTNNV